MAVNTECPEAVRLLLERGADIDAVVSKRLRGVGPRRGRSWRGGTPEWVGVRLEVYRD